MSTLVNLHTLGIKLQSDFELSFTSDDIELPISFKDSIKELGGYKYEYKQCLVHIHSDNLNGYIPNQWFVIASFFVDYYLELQKYKSLLSDCLTKCGYNSAEKRKSVMAMYSTEISKKPKNEDYNDYRLKTVEKIKQLISPKFDSISNLDQADKDLLILFVSDYDWWYGGKSIDRGDFYISPLLALAKVINASHSYIAEICKALADNKSVADNLKNYYKNNSSHPILTRPSSNLPLQSIFYGAPGTGKSFTINNETNKTDESVIRTTFHPDSDYSTFVGSYKPTTVEEPVMTIIGTKAVPVENQDGSKRTESKIVYEFVSQAFLQAYIKAWKFYAEAVEESDIKKQFLVIEEINRGNCAQIFGDVFQLLDRNDYGFSDYPIQADVDMKKQLQKAFSGLEISLKDSINAMYSNSEDTIDKVLKGEILLLPNNLYIWATMNTCDQSLFPIDSAFKRRWDWKYMPIYDANLGYQIKVGENQYDWWKFLQEINALIGSLTSSEDKKLGYFFCKAKDGIITTEVFVGKVIFYLWNDVFKDYEFAHNVFNDNKGEKLTFDKFYSTDQENQTEVINEKVEQFLQNLGIVPIEMSNDQNSYTNNSSINNKSIIRINNKEVKFINAVPYTTIEEYINLNPTKTAQEVYSFWEPFSKYSTSQWIIDDLVRHNNRPSIYADYSYRITLKNGESVWINKDGWMHNPEKQRDTIAEFMEAVNKANIGIVITEIMI